MSKRTPSLPKFTIGAGQTVATTLDGKPASVERFAFGGVHVSEGLDGKTLSFIDNGEWGADVVLTKAVTTGWNYFTDLEARSIGPAFSLTLTVDTSPDVESNVWLKLKS